MPREAVVHSVSASGSHLSVAGCLVKKKRNMPRKAAVLSKCLALSGEGGGGYLRLSVCAFIYIFYIHLYAYFSRMAINV